jgi:hypothetical protein
LSLHGVTSGSTRVTWLEVGLLLTVGFLAGGLAAALWDVRKLHGRLWRRWIIEANLRRDLDVERAKVVQHHG